MVVITSSYAGDIEQKLSNGLIVTASFHQGEQDAPVILILHGLLQTRESHTVERIYNALVDSDYTVLAPTLSLDISQRKQSLACEAIHSHSMQSDISEIELWSRWLHNKTNKKVILVGHSSGSVQQLAYLDQYTYKHIQQAILISLGYFGAAPGSNETALDAQRAQEMIKQNKPGLNTFGLSYCKEYVTTPVNYLSYYSWGSKKILNTMKDITVPITVIIGSKDKRIRKSWGRSMEENKIETIMVKGAGHFFDDEYEFDLQDIIDTLVTAS